MKSILGERRFESDRREKKSGYKNVATVQLLGQGIYHFDKKNFSEALASFNSVLALEPDNMVAKFHKANTYLELDNYKEAMNIYQTILTQSEDVEQIDWAWTFPKRKGTPQTYCSNIAISEEMNMAVILSKGKDGGLIIGFNIELNEIVWENPIPDYCTQVLWYRKISVNVEVDGAIG